MQRIIRPTILNCLVLPGGIGVLFGALALAAVLSDDLATLEVWFCVSTGLAVCALMFFHFRRRVTIVTNEGVAVRNMFGRLRSLSWPEILRSKVIRCTRESAGLHTYMIGSPGSIEVFSRRSRGPVLRIPVSAYREADIQFLLEKLEFKYDYDYDPRQRV